MEYLENRKAERLEMVRRQITARGVRNRKVLSAMRTLPRHYFVPEAYSECAYDDCPLPIGFGQTISQPFMVAYMLEALSLSGAEKVLEVGTGSGYQTALLGMLASEVTSIERITPLAVRAARILSSLGFENAKIIVGDGFEGLSEIAPFDAIIVSAAPTFIPPALAEQLREDGGCMIMPMGAFGAQSLVRITRSGDDLMIERLMDVAFVPMIQGLSDLE
ncbi:MAG: protein-L-isoaspartate(D-aspartate) O-methyltransferase [Spirochaetaceae bacterium]|nr:protein-L-isoaspartate(D-aspartate) O-methyltransferase [Spirochaetaceae bacterium]